MIKIVLWIVNVSVIFPKAIEPRISPDPRPSMQKSAFESYVYSPHLVLVIVSVIILINTEERMAMLIAVESISKYVVDNREFVRMLKVAFIS